MLGNVVDTETCSDLESNDQQLDMQAQRGYSGSDAEREPDDEKNHDMHQMIQHLSTYLSYVQDNGEEIAAGFQRIPNRRVLPDYFEVIAEPIAFSTIRGKIQKKHYTAFGEFVKDVAQICHNAQVYNRPSAPIFGAALRLREIFKDELQKLVQRGEITNEEAKLPDLGELPPAEESPSQESAGEEHEDEEDEDGADDESDDNGVERHWRRSYGRRGPSVSARKDPDDDNDEDSHRRRGRPPMVLNPIEARITSLLKGLRKVKDDNGNFYILPFEKLPDRAAVAEYYRRITNPIAMDNIKKKAKRKKYDNVDQVQLDLELMFENAKLYNEDGSLVYMAAVELQKQARILAEQEKARPDDDFRDEDGKLALSDIRYNDQIWKVGDWVHIRNPNDLAKPIVAQIYRIWQDRAEQKWINACWYYRPEQTVHRHEKYFYEHEVVKTGQYRDHQIGELIDHCFVMFVTRFPKGRPRGFPVDKDVYVCESRYNEEKFLFNKIKTWASCVPDEVREKDYEMDLFDVPRRMRKVPSPIKHLLREDIKDSDDLPKPTWGSPNAPPIVGAVHSRPAGPNESPPPNPTPRSPLAPAVPDTLLEASHHSPQMLPATNGASDISRNVQPHYSTVGPSPFSGQFHTHVTPHFQPVTPVASGQPVQQTPVPIPQPPNPAGTSQIPTRPMQYQQQQQQQQPGHTQNYTPAYPQTQTVAVHQQTASNSLTATYIHGQLPLASRGHIQALSSNTNMYNPPRPPEVYTLPDSVNGVLPTEVRQGYQHDNTGRILFFTSPPLERPCNGLSPTTAGIGHSIKYFAGRGQWLAAREKKRKERADTTQPCFLALAEDPQIPDADITFSQAKHGVE